MVIGEFRVEWSDLGNDSSFTPTIFYGHAWHIAVALMLQQGRMCEDVDGLMSQIVVEIYGNLGPVGHSGPLWAASGCLGASWDAFETSFGRFWATLERLLATMGPLCVASGAFEG